MVADANALGAPKVLAEASNAVQAGNTAVAEAEAEGIDCNCKKKRDCDCDLDLGASCIKIPNLLQSNEFSLSLLHPTPVFFFFALLA